MAEKLNIAVIGSGYWGPNLIRNVAQIPTAMLHTLCDLNEKRLREIADEYHPLHITTQMDDILQNPDIDGVILATPAHTHADFARRMLNAGKHVLVEKPLALNSKDCQDLIDLAAARRRHLMVGHVFVYNPAVLKLKELIDKNELGKVFYIYSTRVNLGQIREDVNVFWNLAPHDLSILNFLLGETPRRVAGHGYNYLRPTHSLEDVVVAILEYPSGIAAHLHTSWLDPNKVRRMTVVGEKKMVVYDDISDNRITIYDKGVTWVQDASSFDVHRLMTYSGDIHIPKLSAAEPLRLEIQHFLDCIRSGDTPRSDGVDGLKVVRVMEAVTQSIQKGGIPIDL